MFSSQIQSALRRGGARWIREASARAPFSSAASAGEFNSAWSALFAQTWTKLLPPTTEAAVESAIAKLGEQQPEQERLASALRSARAVSQFSELVESVQLDVDQAVGLSGSNTKGIDGETLDAIRALVRKFNTYVGSFSDSESAVQKKVEAELGWKLLQLKMRVSDIGEDWGRVGVLGTSGLAASYIESRRT